MYPKKYILILFFFVFVFDVRPIISQNVVRYDLYVNDTTVNYTGNNVDAIAINGQIPGPTLNFTIGDTAEIVVHNQMNRETSLHWHGILLPNDQDGVPFLTYAPIAAHSVFIYKFPILQTGTYWYHAHTALQEQTGLYGALILHERSMDTIPEYTIILSDWTNEKPMEVLRSLKMANDWYAIEKGSTQNYGAAMVQGYLSIKLKQEWLRMYPMDVSDVFYNTMLINGKKNETYPELKAGDQLKLRIINGSASTYFWLQFAGGALQVVASDGMNVVPVSVGRMLIAVAETYDVIITIPENRSYELRATSEDRTKSTSLWLGSGTPMPAFKMPELKYFEGMKMMNNMMRLNGSMESMGMEMSNQQMDMNMLMYPEISGYREEQKNRKDSTLHTQQNTNVDFTTLNYAMLRSPVKTNLPDAPLTTLKFTLTGNMNRYPWSINNTTLGDTDKILIHKGENVRIILDNQTMMRHPMHLHGHFFRVVNGQGDYAPLKNVLDIMPMEIDTIEFAAIYDGDWFFHCHILYHMMSGMGRVFSYADSPPNPQVDSLHRSWQKFTADEDMWHFSASLSGQSNGIYNKMMVMNRKYLIDEMAQVDYRSNLESETHFARYIGKQQFLKLYIGTDIRYTFINHQYIIEETHAMEQRTLGVIGVQYLLPMFMQTELRIDNTGHVRFQVSRNDLALTNRLRMEGMWNSDLEYGIGLRYILLKRVSISANYDSHFGPGAGITFTY